ncbi:MAG: class I SAM-dependent methyltransferase [Gemmatimonadetes bacterium]|nr:MAG: class I SAM-dependent methyltransferase [Gemmatimonadota bacterium]TML60560.1 MAG: class I SAM-dependent methyltransferase [Actinomycetota bacterium]
MSEPALWGLRRKLLDALDKVGLARPAVGAYELALAAKANLAERRSSAAAGLPVPPARLRAQVGPAHADAAFFLRTGRTQADLIRSLVREGGSSVEDLEAILDFGCGCGRVLRHWGELPRTRVFGCDIDPRMVQWCDANLPFAVVSVNDLAPPLPYADSAFDLVYAFSVFTHLSVQLQHAWMRDCLRVLRPDGWLLMSTLGEHYLSLKRLTESEEQAFRRGEVVVLYQHSAGSSLCSAYHPPDYVRERLGADFELVTFRPAADEGRHDLHLFRKPAMSRAGTEQSL